MPPRKKQPLTENGESLSAASKKTVKKPAATPVRKPRAPALTDGACPGPASMTWSSSSRRPRRRRSINISAPTYKVLASYGHVRDLPKRRRKGEQSPASTSRTAGFRPTSSPSARKASPGPAYGQGHPRRAEARGRQGEPHLPGDRPRPRGRGHRLAHRGRAGPRSTSAPSASPSTRSPRRRCRTRWPTPARSTWTASTPRKRGASSIASSAIRSAIC